MASLPLPRFLQQHVEKRDHARALEREVMQQGVDLAQRQIVCDPSDSLTLRGIPAIGRGVAGCIRGTDPAGVVLSRRR
jgi:hypothetical protein